jgi:predicted enzyme involved in methoxymalonyl-ACP biosynthesis
MDCVYLRLEDRFGDYGIVGTAILKYACGICTIDTFLLSCRALGRNVEQLFLVKCLARAKNRGATAAVGKYCATAKNTQACDFYSRMGFEPVPSDSDTDATRVFRYDLTYPLPDEPPYFESFNVMDIYETSQSSSDGKESNRDKV